eukprot:1566010-Alexandrium_andersonii.AAC.1
MTLTTLRLQAPRPAGLLYCAAKRAFEAAYACTCGDAQALRRASVVRSALDCRPVAVPAVHRKRRS